jgi:transcriptional regulator
MRTSRLFAATDEQVDRLISLHPLALFVSVGEDGLSATPLPLLLQHFAGSNPQIEELERSPEALAIFNGPHGYISPSWFTDRTQAPTWNYATVHMRVHVTIDRSIEAARHSVDYLTEKMEEGRCNAWSTADMGPRYERLIPGVVAFTAEVRETQVKFKLGQNERVAVLLESLIGLDKEASLTLADMMRTANETRL